MTYYLINTMEQTGGNHVGRILSAHRSEGAAERANAKLQRSIQRSNGSTDVYLPTVIRSSVEVYRDVADAYRSAEVR